MLKNRMAYITERQSVLAQNVANVDTPGYKPKDLEKVNFRQMATSAAKKVDLKTTNPKHVGGNSFDAGKFAVVRQKDTFEIKPSGNEVSLEQQMLKMSENSLDYQTTTSIYRKMTEMMRNALGGSN